VLFFFQATDPFPQFVRAFFGTGALHIRIKLRNPFASSSSTCLYLLDYLV